MCAGLDGYYRGWEYGGSFQTIKLTWWVNGPIEWGQFTSWVEKLQEYLHSQVFPGEASYDRGPWHS